MDVSVDPYYVLLLSSLKRLFGPVTLTDGRKLNVIPASILDSQVLSTANLPRFAQAFTTEYYDMSDLSKSYERFETLGDLFSNKFVGLVIHRHFPDLNQSELSNMLAYYKSNKEFAQYIGIAIPNINQLIRRHPGMEVTTKMLGDVFEALIYVTYSVVDEIIRSGDAIAENLFHVMSQGFTPNKKYAKGNPKSLILQVFNDKKMFDREGRHIGLVTELPPVGRFDGVLTVTLPEAKVREVSKIMNRGPIRTLSVTVHDQDRKKATTMAYGLLIEKLQKDDGFSVEEYEAVKQANYIKSFPQANRVHAKEAEMREKVSFVKKASHIEGMLDYRLVGLNEDTGKRRLIATETVTKGSEGFHIAKDKLLYAYIGSRA